MRDVPSSMDEVWQTGDFTTSDRRAIARVTIQHVDMRLFDLGYNLYASMIFGATPALPKELPNVKSVRWNRSVDSDVATGTIELYNTAPQPLGTVFQPQFGLDQPGYYTFTRGRTSFSSRWGDVPNEWQGLIVPDNIVRTYEGYGFDAASCPEDDPHLVQTGLWIIKDVEYTASGLITLTIEDFGALLRDQIAFHPVIPKNFYPLSFSTEPKQSGFNDGYTYTKTIDSGGNYDPSHPPPDNWTGPNAAVPSVVVTAGDARLLFAWNAVTAPPSGYVVVGYNLIIDGVRLGEIVPRPTGTLTYSIGIVNGNSYTAQVAVVYRQVSTGHEHVGPYGTLNHVLPHQAGGTSVVTTVLPDAGPPPSSPTDPTVPLVGTVAWEFTGTADSFTVVVFQGDDRHFFTVSADGTGRQYLACGLGTLVGFGILIYGYTGGQIGQGCLYQGSGEYFAPPTNGAPPHEPNPTQPTPTVTTTKGTVPLSPVQVKCGFSNTSNTYYVGAGANISVYGHTPAMALDTDATTYWLSIGNQRNDQGYSYEWYEVTVPNVELSQVRINSAKTGYFVYLSVYAKGTWVHYKASDIIPYDPNNPLSHNGGNIPYVATLAEGTTELHLITLKTPIPGATKVRVTFHNLQDFGLGEFHYRAGLRSIVCYASSTATTAGSTAPAPIPGPPQDDNNPETSTSYTTYVPPKIAPGAGEQPGFYEDYTDLIKLFCAWGGFYWPPDAAITDSCGVTTNYGFGPTHFGLPNVDPVLGDENGGRVWGDFADTGTAGIANLPIPQWDKKSLLDCINYVRDIIGFVFYIDEGGGVVWRLPNIFSVGNYVGNIADSPARIADIVTIDETQTLIDLRAQLSSRNVRERYFIASVDGKTGALAQGYNPNPAGLRRVGGWTDQNFASTTECQLMADMIAIRALLAYHQDTIQIAGYPRIQIDDQVRIFERTTGEGYLHYVRSISSNNDLESGVWTYDAETSWLGDTPFSYWVFEIAQLSAELQGYLDATNAIGADATPAPTTDRTPGVNSPGPTSAPAATTTTTGTDVPKVSKLVKVTGATAVYITDGITRRWVRNADDKTFLVSAGLVPSATPTVIAAAELARIELIGVDEP